MPRFSLREILIAVLALAVGLSIWRTPKGDWLDIPLATLSFYFVRSFLQRATATRRLLRDDRSLACEQRWGGRLLLAAMTGLAIILVVAWSVRFLVANGQLSMLRDNGFNSVRLPLLPRDLAMLAMLAATGLSYRRTETDRALRTRQTVYVMIAVAVVAVGLMAYEADQTLIPFLVYLSVNGIALYQPPRFMPPELNVSNSVRVHHFSRASFAGLALLLLNLLLITGLAKSWNQRNWRWTLLLLLTGGLVAEGWFSSQIVFRRVRQLSPEMAEAITVSPSVVIIVALMILVAATAVVWSSLAETVSCDRSIAPEHRRRFFHESWLGSLLLGVSAATAVIAQWIIDFQEVLPHYKSKPLDLQLIAFILTLHPATGIGLAAAIGGLALAWIRLRKPDELISDVLPQINPASFLVTLLSLMIAVILAHRFLPRPVLATGSSDSERRFNCSRSHPAWHQNEPQIVVTPQAITERLKAAG